MSFTCKSCFCIRINHLTDAVPERIKFVSSGTTVSTSKIYISMKMNREHVMLSIEKEIFCVKKVKRKTSEQRKKLSNQEKILSWLKIFFYSHLCHKRAMLLPQAKN